MSEEVIKTTSCCPEAMMGSMMGSMFNRRDDGLATAALMNGANGWQSNPFIYLVWMMFANRMWGNDNGKLQDAEIQGQLSDLRNQMADNHNSDLLMSAIQGNNNDLKTLAANLNCDFNQLQSSVCDVRNGISVLAGKVDSSAEKVVNSVINGNLQMTQALKDCCCQTQQNIIRMGYENQLGQKDMLNAIQQGFSYTNTGIERAASNIGNLLQTLACDIKTSGDHNTQRIVDVLNAHWNQDLQHRLDRTEMQLSQERQNATIIAAIKGTTTTATT